MPALRFPGFVGEWEEKTIGDIADVLQGFGFPDKYQGQTSGDLPFCKVGDISAAVDKGERIISHAANYVDYSLLPTLHARPIPEGATIFAKIGEAIRSNKRIMTGCPCLIDNNAAAVKAKEGESDEFVFYLMSKVNLADYAGGIVPSVNKSTIETISVFIPPTIAEQKKIASCLSDIDSLIAAQSQIVAAVKEKKKGLLQQLFPQSGENTPRLSFPGFSSEWEKLEIGQLCSVNRGVRVTRKDLDGDGQYPVFQNTNSPMGYYHSYNVNANNPFVIIGGSAGSMGFCKTAFWAADDCVFFGDNESIDKYFLFLTLLVHELEVKSNVRGGNIPRIDRKALERISISIPSVKEQKKIASCLSVFDDAILAETDKLNALKVHKKGLMQQLFPNQ